MQTNLMKVFYGADGLPYKDKERTVHYPIIGSAFMGASNTTEIRFYADRIGGGSFQWVVIGKLPNGRVVFTPIVGSPQEDSETGENYLLFSLTSPFTQYKGDLFLSLGGYQGSVDLEDEGVILEMASYPVYEKTGAVKLNIAYATLIGDSNDQDVQTWEAFLSVLATKADKEKVFIQYETYSALVSDSENYEDGQLFFCQETYSFYKLVSGSLEVLYNLNAYRDRVGLIKRSGVFSSSSGLSAPQLVEAKKQFCIMLYTGVTPREMYIKVSGVAHETEVIIYFLKIDDGVIKDDVNKTWTRRYKKFGFSANDGSLLSTVDNSITSYQKGGVDDNFPKLSGNNTFSGTNVFDISPQTNDNIDSGTKLTTKNYVDGKINDVSGDITSVGTRVSAIENKIPSEASSSNKLADKDFVNSTINSLAAYYITKNAQGDPFATYAELTSATTFFSGGVVRTPTRNDYCLVNSDENHDNASCRYIYQNGQWEFQFIVNETAFTAEQLAALNSGITATLVGQIGTNQNDITDIKSKMPKMKDYVVSTSAWALVDGKYVAEINAGDDFVIDDDMQKIYTGTSASDNDIIGNYGIIIASDETTQKFTLTCYRGDTAPESALNFTVSQYGGY